MESSFKTRRPQALIVRGLGLGQLLSIGSNAPSRPPAAHASYAVYSGALSLPHAKSSWRLS